MTDTEGIGPPRRDPEGNIIETGFIDVVEDSPWEEMHDEVMRLMQNPKADDHSIINGILAFLDRKLRG